MTCIVKLFFDMYINRLTVMELHLFMSDASHLSMQSCLLLSFFFLIVQLNQQNKKKEETTNIQNKQKFS